MRKCGAVILPRRGTMLTRENKNRGCLVQIPGFLRFREEMAKNIDFFRKMGYNKIYVYCEKTADTERKIRNAARVCAV
jgi:hypothetical protein